MGTHSFLWHQAFMEYKSGRPGKRAQTRKDMERKKLQRGRKRERKRERKKKEMKRRKRKWVELANQPRHCRHRSVKEQEMTKSMSSIYLKNWKKQKEKKEKKKGNKEKWKEKKLCRFTYKDFDDDCCFGRVSFIIIIIF